MLSELITLSLFSKKYFLHKFYIKTESFRNVTKFSLKSSLSSFKYKTEDILAQEDSKSCAYFRPSGKSEIINLFSLG